jgi:hypothetical protein
VSIRDAGVAEVERLIEEPGAATIQRNGDTLRDIAQHEQMAVMIRIYGALP